MSDMEIKQSDLGPADAGATRGLPERAVEEVVSRFRDAYDAGDVDAVVELFAEDGDWRFSPGTFTGKEGVRRVMEWDVRLSPTVTCREPGIEIVATGNVGLSELVVEQTAEGIPFTYPMLTVFELNDEGKIQHARSYYDKLAIMHEVASKYPGIKGWFFRKTVNMVVAQGEKGLERSSTAGG